MNLFRSEEHAQNWNGFKPGTKEGILSLSELVKLFSCKLFTRRLEPDYVSGGRYFEEFLEALTELGKSRPFWSPKK